MQVYAGKKQSNSQAVQSLRDYESMTDSVVYIRCAVHFRGVSFVGDPQTVFVLFAVEVGDFLDLSAAPKYIVSRVLRNQAVRFETSAEYLKRHSESSACHAK